MISPEQRAKIRRLFYAEHWRIGTIAAELGVHHDTVRAAIEAHRFRNPPPRIRSSPLAPYKPFIIEILQQYPRLRATRLHQMLQARGFAGSVRQVRRYVRTVRPARTREAFMRMQTLPGEQAQVDWGSFGWLQVGRARRRLSCFVMVLSHSRAMYARFSLNQTAPSFLHSHVRAFEYFGGVPREILYDNLKSVVLERDGDHIRFHPTILELAGHYHFAPKPCAPYRANEKGRVERSIQYLRHSFFTAREPTEIDALNRDLLAWIDDVAHARPQPRDPDGRTVGAAFLEEKESLLPLPEHAFPCELVKAVRSGKTPFIRFDLNDYSIPHAYVRQPLTLVADDRHVRFLAGGDVIARHERSWDRGQVIRDDRHLADLATEKRRGRALMGRDRLRHHCPSAEGMLQAIAQRNQPIRSQTAHLNRLIDRYGAEAVEQAMAEALRRGTPSAASVAHILPVGRRTAAATTHASERRTAQAYAHRGLHAYLSYRSGSVDVLRGDVAKAQRYFTESAEVLRSAVGDRHPYISGAYQGLGEVALVLQRAEDAIELLQQALEISGAGRDSKARVAMVEFLLAQALALDGQLERARAVAADALKHFRQQGWTNDGDYVQLWLGRQLN